RDEEEPREGENECRHDERNRRQKRGWLGGDATPATEEDGERNAKGHRDQDGEDGEHDAGGNRVVVHRIVEHRIRPRPPPQREALPDAPGVTAVEREQKRGEYGHERPCEV